MMQNCWMKPQPKSSEGLLWQSNDYVISHVPEDPWWSNYLTLFSVCLGWWWAWRVYNILYGGNEHNSTVEPRLSDWFPGCCFFTAVTEVYINIVWKLTIVITEVYSYIVLWKCTGQPLMVISTWQSLVLVWHSKANHLWIFWLFLTGLL